MEEIIFRLQDYWKLMGCSIIPSFDMEVGAGTFHPATFFSAISGKSHRFAYIQPSRRPSDGRYGENPNRLQKYFQFQVLITPSPELIQEIYLGSLRYLGISTKSNDIKFIEDNWKSPTLGAHGLGWEVWLNGMEITQFTYFQRMGGIECDPIPSEITYGVERLAMYLQKTDSIFDVIWSDSCFNKIKYGDLFMKAEKEFSKYNFELANIDTLLKIFEFYEEESLFLIRNGLPLPAYEMAVKSSHIFNLLDSRNSVSVTERQNYILRIRNMTQKIANTYYEESRKM